jgi:hypothetical protein
MRVLTVNEVEQVSGAFSCVLNPNPINWTPIISSAAMGAIGGSWPGLVLSGGGAYLNDRWICTF